MFKVGDVITCANWDWTPKRIIEIDANYITTVNDSPLAQVKSLSKYWYKPSVNSRCTYYSETLDLIVNGETK